MWPSLPFTQGLDQGSLMMTDKYDTDAEYAQALQARIADEHGNMVVPSRPALPLV